MSTTSNSEDSSSSSSSKFFAVGTYLASSTSVTDAFSRSATDEDTSSTSSNDNGEKRSRRSTRLYQKQKKEREAHERVIARKVFGNPIIQREILSHLSRERDRIAFSHTLDVALRSPMARTRTFAVVRNVMKRAASCLPTGVRLVCVGGYPEWLLGEIVEFKNVNLLLLDTRMYVDYGEKIKSAFEIAQNWKIALGADFEVSTKQEFFGEFHFSRKPLGKLHNAFGSIFGYTITVQFYSYFLNPSKSKVSPMLKVLNRMDLPHCAGTGFYLTDDDRIRFESSNFRPVDLELCSLDTLEDRSYKWMYSNDDTDGYGRIVRIVRRTRMLTYCARLMCFCYGRFENDFKDCAIFNHERSCKNALAFSIDDFDDYLRSIINDD